MNLKENAALWKARIAEASQGNCRICGVTKTHSAEEINPLLDCGIDLIGENRVQELLSKQDALDRRFHVQLIGRLQTNKVKSLVGRVEAVQSLDRPELARELSRRSLEKGLVTDTLIQVSIAGEAQKGGVPPEGLEELLRVCAQAEGIKVSGLMAVMPLTQDAEALRPLFKKMRALFEALRERDLGKNISMRELSMGMTNDALIAAEEGATMVRLGRALFGERK